MKAKGSSSSWLCTSHCVLLDVERERERVQQRRMYYPVSVMVKKSVDVMVVVSGLEL